MEKYIVAAYLRLSEAGRKAAESESMGFALLLFWIMLIHCILCALYENFVRETLTQREYVEIKETNQAQKEADSLDRLTESKILLPEHNERFVARAVVFRDGWVYFEL